MYPLHWHELCVLLIFLTEAKIPDAVLHVLSLGGVGVCPSNFPDRGQNS